MKTRLVVLLCVVMLPSAFPQGALTPPGPPGSTMKTLDQLDQHLSQAGEKRTDVLTLSGGENNQYIINAPGSYYLSANLAGVNGLHGISIQTDNATVDLNGFAIIAAAGTSFNGIDIPGAQTGVAIRNGSITGWHRAISAETAIGGRLEKLIVNNNTSTGTLVHQGWFIKDSLFIANGGTGLAVRDNCQILDSLAKDNTNSGFLLLGNGELIAHCSAYANKQTGIAAEGLGATIVDCTVQFNASSGIITLGNSTVSHCVADQNINFGIDVGATGLVTDSTATRNTKDGMYAPGGEVVFSKDISEANQGYGFNTTGGANSANSVFQDCAAADNNLGGILSGLATIVDGCSVYKNTGVGISVSDSSRLTNNSVRESDNDAIRITAGSYALNNTCDYNGRVVTSAAGIAASGPQNRIEGNNVTSNLNAGIGIKVSSAGNLILKNSARGNSTNYSIVANNRYGAIVDVTGPNATVVNGNSAASTASTDPWANFSY